MVSAYRTLSILTALFGVYGRPAAPSLDDRAGLPIDGTPDTEAEASEPAESQSTHGKDQKDQTLIKVMGVVGAIVALVGLCFVVTWRRRVRKRTRQEMRSTAPDTTDEARASNDAAQRIRAANDATQLLRRTESGTSLKTLPEYHKALAEGEARLSKALEPYSMEIQTCGPILEIGTAQPVVESAVLAVAVEVAEDVAETLEDTHARPEMVENTNDWTGTTLGVRTNGSHNTTSGDNAIELLGENLATSIRPCPIYTRRLDSAATADHSPSTPSTSAGANVEQNKAKRFLPRLPSFISSPLRRDSQSEQSLTSPTHKRRISSPVSITHLQVQEPAAGFSVQQLAFLSSVESLGRYGIAVPQDGDRSCRSPPPAFEEHVELHSADQPHLLSRSAPVLTSGEVQCRAEQQQRLHSLTHRIPATTIVSSHMTPL